MLNVATSVVYAEVPSNQLTELELGQRIYQQGILPSGKPLQGQRMETMTIEGEAAACVKCHRQSGMGSLEGNISVPPITGRFLFAKPDDELALAVLDPRTPSNLTRAHTPYDDMALAKAIREGIKVDGSTMNPLMPKYTLNDTELKALSAYLRQLSAQLPSGVTPDAVRFATVITPEVDTKRRDVMVKMMRSAFAQRNASQQQSSGRMRMGVELVPHAIRNWQLDVWELKGAPETWTSQLAAYQQHQPVFALLSGVSNTTWEPVHTFCQQEKLPCLFPSVVLPPEQPQFYPLYFSGGVRLEARVLAKYLRAQGKKAPHRLVQVYRDDSVGRSATEALTTALKNSGISVENRMLTGTLEQNGADLLKKLAKQDGLVLWLPAADMATLNKLKPASAMSYASGYLLAGYQDFSTAWQRQLRLIYPYELGVKRQTNTAKLLAWLKTWGLPLVDEGFQAEVFFNLLLLTDLTSQMLDNYYRDYLVERAEDMLSWGANVSAYPHLSLAPGQRFASKGAYIARFAKDGKWVADSDWLVP